MSLKSGMVNSLKLWSPTTRLPRINLGGRTNRGWQTGLVEPARAGRPPSVLPQRKGDARV